MERKNISSEGESRKTFGVINQKAIRLTKMTTGEGFVRLADFWKMFSTKVSERK